jgi:hypothetical protein
MIAILLAALLFNCGPSRSILHPPLLPQTEISFWEGYTISGVDIKATLMITFIKGEIIDYYMLKDTLRLVLPDSSVINASLSSPTLEKEF